MILFVFCFFFFFFFFCVYVTRDIEQAIAAPARAADKEGGTQWPQGRVRAKSAAPIRGGAGASHPICRHVDVTISSQKDTKLPLMGGAPIACDTVKKEGRRPGSDT